MRGVSGFVFGECILARIPDAIQLDGNVDSPIDHGVGTYFSQRLAATPQPDGSTSSKFIRCFLSRGASDSYNQMNDILKTTLIPVHPCRTLLNFSEIHLLSEAG
jgi:hypothetical protein